jgi:hypothetical protein
MQLEAAKILRHGRIRRTAEEGCEGPHVPDIVVARLLDEVAHGHVFDHALAQRADGLLTHRGSCLEVEVVDPLILKTGRPACHPVALTWSLRQRHWLRFARSALPRKRVRSLAHSGPAIPPPCRVCFLAIPVIGSAKPKGRRDRF